MWGFNIHSVTFAWDAVVWYESEAVGSIYSIFTFKLLMLWFHIAMYMVMVYTLIGSLASLATRITVFLIMTLTAMQHKNVTVSFRSHFEWQWKLQSL